MNEAKRCIDAERLKKVINLNFGGFGGAQVMMQLIDAQPSENIEPVAHGAWIWVPVSDCKSTLCCSVCGGAKNASESAKFCPNCGAKMREDGGKVADIENAIEEMQSCLEITIGHGEVQQANCYELAIFALKEKAERGKGCEYCRGNNWRNRTNMPLQESSTEADVCIDTDNSICISNIDVHDDALINITGIKYCPMCGRKLVQE